MSLKLAIVGLRHGHIYSVINEAKSLGVELVAVAEEDAATRESLKDSDQVKITHSCFKEMLAEVPFDILGIGDYYSKRGSLAIAGLKAGKHIIADKPLCTCLDELEEIRKLATEKNLAVSSMFGLRNNYVLNAMKEKIDAGAIGEVRTIAITGQHPLRLGVRPGWYFEKGKHGGTINDIGIHAVDLIQWLTGLKISEVSAARCWNAKAKDTPWFQDCAQIMLELNNGGGVIADFSYLSPDTCGFDVRQYWRVTVHGDDGLLEIQNGDANLMFADSKSEKPEMINCEAGSTGESFLEQIIKEIENKTDSSKYLTTQYVLDTSKAALQLQKAADENLCQFKLN